MSETGVGETMGDSGEKLNKSAGGGKRKGGLSFAMAAFFLVTQMAGAGFLALPKSMADAGKYRFLYTHYQL